MSVLLFLSLWALVVALPGAVGWYAGARFDRSGLRDIGREWTLACGFAGLAGVLFAFALGSSPP